MKKIILFILIGMFLISGCDEIEPQTGTTTTTQEQPQESKEKGSLEKLRDSLEESKQRLDELDKVDECTKLCSGDSYDIPAVRDEMYMGCYEAYYYGGVELLDEFIEGCK